MAKEPTEHDLLLPFESERLRGNYKEYFKTKRNNSFATIQAFPGIWNCFQLLDEIWMREFDDLQRLLDPNQMLPAILFMNGRAQFRVALELGFSCCIGDAWNVLRSGIESVAHAHKIIREPQLAKAWAEKDDGPTQAEAFKDAFERNKKQSLFPSEHGLDTLHKYWSEFSEWGTHTTVAALGKRFASEETKADVNWKLNYFEAQPERLALYLFSLFLASFFMEKACFDAFEERLKLDPQLLSMRTQLDGLRQRTATEIINRFKLTPPAIWP